VIERTPCTVVTALSSASTTSVSMISGVAPHSSPKPKCSEVHIGKLTNSILVKEMAQKNKSAMSIQAKTGRRIEISERCKILTPFLEIYDLE